MTPTEEDKITLEVLVEQIYISPRHYNTTEATEVEKEIMEKMNGFKAWANKLIKDKLNK